jgi:hypothetical protein
MTKVYWTSDADLSNPDCEDNLERQSDLCVMDVYIQNPGNERSLDELKTDDEVLELLEDLEKFAPAEIEVFEDYRHEPFNISAYFDNEEDCKKCAAVHSRGSYGSPSTLKGWHTAERVVAKKEKAMTLSDLEATKQTFKKQN